jgi:hypothetical protein
VAWDVLEGNVISAFLSGFWYELGKRGLPQFELIGVELLQQTPLDTVLGDLLIANARLVRLIEFKRELNTDDKEPVKLSRLKAGLGSSSFAFLESISREIHWYVLTNFNKSQNSVVVPYLDLESPAGDRDLPRFIEETVNALARPGINEDDLREYIQLLGRCFRSGRIARTTGGLVFTVNHQGKSIFVPIRDVQELAMTPRLILEERRMTLERQMKQQPEIEMKEQLSFRRPPRVSL